MKIEIPKQNVYMEDGSVRCICTPKKKNGTLGRGKLLHRKLTGTCWESTYNCPNCKCKITIASDLPFAYVEDNQQNPYMED